MGPPRRGRGGMGPPVGVRGVRDPSVGGVQLTKIRVMSHM